MTRKERGDGQNTVVPDIWEAGESMHKSEERVQRWLSVGKVSMINGLSMIEAGGVSVALENTKAGGILALLGIASFGLSLVSLKMRRRSEKKATENRQRFEEMMNSFDSFISKPKLTLVK